ncbi:hypothetical protein ILUMI_23801 [Ignelater luminosus]|uniref:Uncharacterized protein n=1 Tax=Ignelater luminosus TaxID=2038154 RepID=A0A8K0CBF7_IGNLU|nr:hypothetical protein ILUMI_23801 [Ignelater luminosus]
MLILKTKKCVIIFAFLIIVLFAITECKRGGGGRRGGTYRGSSNVWGRAKQSQNGQANYDMYGQRRAKSQSSGPVQDPNKKVEASPDTHKASAPPAPKNQKTVQESSAGASSSDFIQQEKKQQAAPLGTSNVQQQQQRPIGWDVGQNPKPDTNINKNVGWNVGNPNHAQGGLASQQHIYPSQTYAAHAYPNTGASNYYGTGTNYNYGAGANYNYGSNYHQPQYNPNQQFAGHYPTSNMAGIGGTPYYNNMNGYGQAPAYGNSYGGTNHGGGMFSGLLGGSKYGKHGGFGGYGGLGGYGGWGGHGIGGYGKRFGGGFGMGFGKHAFRNVMIGLLVWNLVSGLTRRPYYVYNYYNNPEKVPEEIPLPVNAIVLCPENVTSLCAPNTAPLCTSNNTIMCVVLAQETVPCDDNSTLKCANSTVTCIDGTEDACDDTEKKKNVANSVNIPCVTNATIIGKIMDNTTITFSGTGTLLNKGSMGDTTTLCVTLLALPQPEEEANKGVMPLCNVENANATACTNNATVLLTNSTVLIQETSTVQPLAM